MRGVFNKCRSWVLVRWVIVRWYVDDLVAVAVPAFIVAGILRASWSFWGWVFG